MSEIDRFSGSGQLTEDEPMSRHVTWRAGGCVRFAYTPRNYADLAQFFTTKRADISAYPPLFVGLGSNLLVRDGGLAATAIFTHPGLADLRIERNDESSIVIYAQAGIAAPKLARFAASHDLVGSEFLAGIPGTVGGALAMNAGCYGGETWEFVETVETIDAAGARRDRPASDYRIGYRSVEMLHDRADTQRAHSLGDEWFVGARFRFRKGSGEAARERIKDLLAKRAATQPLNLPNAGSVFRNPPGDHAARVIEACGLKGHTIGGACVSEKHANFIVNPGGTASANDIESLILHMQATVALKTGIRLEPEVRIVGNR